MESKLKPRLDLFNPLSCRLKEFNRTQLSICNWQVDAAPTLMYFSFISKQKIDFPRFNKFLLVSNDQSSCLVATLICKITCARLIQSQCVSVKGFVVNEVG